MPCGHPGWSSRPHEPWNTVSGGERHRVSPLSPTPGQDADLRGHSLAGSPFPGPVPSGQVVHVNEESLQAGMRGRLPGGGRPFYKGQKGLPRARHKAVAGKGRAVEVTRPGHGAGRGGTCCSPCPAQGPCQRKPQQQNGSSGPWDRAAVSRRRPRCHVHCQLPP